MEDVTTVVLCKHKLLPLKGLWLWKNWRKCSKQLRIPIPSTKWSSKPTGYRLWSPVMWPILMSLQNLLHRPSSSKGNQWQETFLPCCCFAPSDLGTSALLQTQGDIFFLSLPLTTTLEDKQLLHLVRTYQLTNYGTSRSTTFGHVSVSTIHFMMFEPKTIRPYRT